MEKMIKIFIALIISLSAINAGGVMPYGDLNNGMPIIGAGQVPDLYQFLPVPKPKPPTTLAPVDLNSFTVPQIPQQNVVPTEITPSPAPAETTPPAAEVKPGKYPADAVIDDSAPYSRDFRYYMAKARNKDVGATDEEDKKFLNDNSEYFKTINVVLDPKNKNDKKIMSFLDGLKDKRISFKDSFLDTKDQKQWNDFVEPKDKKGNPIAPKNYLLERIMYGYLDAKVEQKLAAEQSKADAEAAKSEAERLSRTLGKGDSYRHTESGPMPGAYESAMEAYNKIVANNKEEFDRYNAAYEGLKTFREEQFGKEEKDYKKWADIYAGGEPESFTQEKRAVPEGVGMNPVTGYAGVIYPPSEKEPPTRDYPQRLPLPPVPQVSETTATSEYTKSAPGPKTQTKGNAYFSVVMPDGTTKQYDINDPNTTLDNVSGIERNLNNMSDNIKNLDTSIHTLDAARGKVQVNLPDGIKEKKEIMSAYVAMADIYLAAIKKGDLNEAKYPGIGDFKNAISPYLSGTSKSVKYGNATYDVPTLDKRKFDLADYAYNKETGALLATGKTGTLSPKAVGLASGIDPNKIGISSGFNDVAVAHASNGLDGVMNKFFDLNNGGRGILAMPANLTADEQRRWQIIAMGTIPKIVLFKLLNY